MPLLIVLISTISRSHGQYRICDMTFLPLLSMCSHSEQCCHYSVFVFKISSLFTTNNSLLVLKWYYLSLILSARFAIREHKYIIFKVLNKTFNYNGTCEICSSSNALSCHMLCVIAALQYTKLSHVVCYCRTFYTLSYVKCCVLLQHCNTLNYVSFVLLQYLAAGWLFDYSFRCQPVDYSNSPKALRVSSNRM
jgi:hypothetical protein